MKDNKNWSSDDDFIPYDDETDQYYQDAMWSGVMYPTATWKEIEDATKMIMLRQEPHRQVEATPEDWLDTWCFIRDLKISERRVI